MAQVVETEKGPMLTSKTPAHSLSRGDVITDPQTGEPHNLLTVLDGTTKGRSLILTVGHAGTHRELWTTQNHPYRRVTVVQQEDQADGKRRAEIGATREPHRKTAPPRRMENPTTGRTKADLPPHRREVRR